MVNRKTQAMWAAVAFAFALPALMQAQGQDAVSVPRPTAYPGLGKIQRLYIDGTGNGSPPSRQFAKELRQVLANSRCVELADNPKGAPVVLSDHPVDRFVSADDDPYVSCDTQGDSVTCKGLGVSATADSSGIYEGPETEKAYVWMFVDTKTDIIVDNWEMSDGADVSSEVRKTVEALGCGVPKSSPVPNHSPVAGETSVSPTAKTKPADHKKK